MDLVGTSFLLLQAGNTNKAEAKMSSEKLDFFMESRVEGGFGDVADGMVPLPSRMMVVTPSGTEAGIFMPTALFAMGADNAEALGKLNLGRVR